MNGMREILEDSFLIYREELENLFGLLLPAVIVGPVGLMIAASGMNASLAMIPVLLLLYLGTSAACLHWAGYQANHMRSPGRTWWTLLREAPNIIVSTAPVALVLVVVSVCGLFLADQGFDYLAWLAAIAGTVATCHWLSGHAYELPLVMAFDASSRQARALSGQLDYKERRATLRLLAVIGAPMYAVALLGVWLALAIHPIVGAAVFLLAGTLWLPFAALCLVTACDRILREAELAARQPVERVVTSAMPARR